MAAQFGCWCVLALLLSPAASEASEGVLDAIVNLLEVGTQFIRDTFGIQYTKPKSKINKDYKREQEFIKDYFGSHYRKAPVQIPRSFHQEEGLQIHKSRMTRPYSILSDLSCYNAPEEELEPLESFYSPTRTVFFFETSCKGDLNSRQACAVESAAAANPNWSIVVIFTGPLKRSFTEGTNFEKLSSIPNIQIRRMNIYEFTKGSPVHHLFVRGDLVNSMHIHPVVYSMDILRILILYRLGGIYLNFNVIAIKEFDPLPKNFVVRHHTDALKNAVIAISKDEIGAEFGRMILRVLGTNYKPNSWAANGLQLISRVLNKTCDSVDHNKRSADICEGIKVFEPDSFYPIRWYDLHKYYEDNPIKETEAYTHHMFNSLRHKLKVSPNTLYSRLAAKYCPNIYEL